MAAKEQEPKGKRLLVIDTDAGIDDAEAILLALSYSSEWKILAITCCCGNTNIDNVCQNVMKILVASDNLEIPVYRGCEQAFVWKGQPSMYHGNDGLGNVADQFPIGDLKISEGHAVNILTKLAREFPNQITLLALAPLTNIAIAHRIDPDFTKLLKELIVMGGNIYGEGNVTSAAEFNFYCDPESAHIILSEANCPVIMVPWEITVKHAMEWDFYREWIKVDSKKGQFIQKITAYSADRLHKRKKYKRFLDCDFLAAAAVLCPQSVEDTIQYPVSIETGGLFTRGHSVVERSLHVSDEINTKKHVKIVTKFNDELLNTLRLKLVQS